MTRIILMLLVFATMSANAIADEQSHRAAAIRFMNSPSQKQIMDQMMSPETLTAQMKAQFPQIPQEKLSQVVAISIEELEKIRPQMESAILEASIQIMSEEEIIAIDEFYRTALGASIATKMQPMMQVSFQLMAPHIQNAQHLIGKRVTEVMKQ